MVQVTFKSRRDVCGVCDGDGSTCADGAACTVGLTCTSGFCVSGVCWCVQSSHHLPIGGRCTRWRVCVRATVTLRVTHLALCVTRPRRVPAYAPPLVLAWTPTVTAWGPVVAAVMAQPLRVISAAASTWCDPEHTPAPCARASAAVEQECLPSFCNVSSRGAESWSASNCSGIDKDCPVPTSAPCSRLLVRQSMRREVS